MNVLRPRLYLASQSPRRRELLEQIGLDYIVLMTGTEPPTPLNVDESPLPDEAPVDYVQRVCLAKVNAGWDELTRQCLPNAPVLGADTIVTLDGEIFGKPNSAEMARAMLRRFSGRAHQVMTAVAVRLDQRVECRLSISTVHFIELSADRINHYVKSGAGNDKAGAYGIQGPAGAFVRYLEGSYTGVMGLPVYETVELLRHFDHPTP